MLDLSDIFPRHYDQANISARELHIHNTAAIAGLLGFGFDGCFGWGSIFLRECKDDIAFLVSVSICMNARV
jgi:hypothetical protein